jgi:hypothetical protein
VRIVVVLAAVGCTAFLVAVGAAAQAPLRALPDCAGKPQVRPSSVILSCADANFGVRDVAWVGWGESRAVGIGSAFVNDCSPNCAAGHFHSYPAVVIASGSRRCATNELAYTTITYAFIGPSPFPSTAPGTVHPQETFRCS